MMTSCDAVGRERRSLYKTGFTLGCVHVFHGLIEGTADAALLPPELEAALAGYRRVYEGYEPADARYLQLHTGHLMWARPEEERFVTPDLIRMATFTGTRDELRDRVRTLAAAGYDQVAVQLVPGHETAIDDWADLFAGV